MDVRTYLNEQIKFRETVLRLYEECALEEFEVELRALKMMLNELPEEEVKATNLTVSSPSGNNIPAERSHEENMAARERKVMEKMSRPVPT